MVHDVRRPDHATVVEFMERVRAAAARFADWQQVLAFEASHRRETGKANAILETFDVPASRYYQRLNRIIDTDEALKHDPVLVHRLLDARDRRLAVRASRRFPKAHE